VVVLPTRKQHVAVLLSDIALGIEVVVLEVDLPIGILHVKDMLVKSRQMRNIQAAMALEGAAPTRILSMKEHEEERGVDHLISTQHVKDLKMRHHLRGTVVIVVLIEE